VVCWESTRSSLIFDRSRAVGNKPDAASVGRVGDGSQFRNADQPGGKVVRGSITSLRSVRLWLGLLLAVALLSPLAARADTDLTIGGGAVVAYANGDDVRLRSEPGLDGGVLDLVPEGAQVDVIDGPVSADDGSLWYVVDYEGQSGYMIADYLAAADFAPAGETATVASDLNLRAGPSTDDAVLDVMPGGATVALTGESSGGFVGVVYDGTTGWAYAAFLSGDGVPSPEGTATATDYLNLRSGPGADTAVRTVIPVGATVTLTGESSGGFLSVRYDGVDGWASADFLDAGGSAPPAPSGVAVTTSALNLRAGPATSFNVLTVLPFGASVATTGAAQAGFYPIDYGGQEGWAAADFLDFDGVPSASRIAWPFGGGAQWYISQGYNGSSHYNANSTYQYHYSFDLARVDGNTAGEPVYSPVSGTIRWIDPSTGGMSINLGDGYAVAFFHVTLAPGLADGQQINQGDYVGYVSGPGGQGFRQFPHIHLTVWQTTDGGNWSRVAVPFTGVNAIAGREFPDIGGGNQWGGTHIP
jgi:uncharacterized protein YraI